MYKCEKCGIDFKEDWRKDRKTRRATPIPLFCSQSCTNGRAQSEAANEKRRIKLTGRPGHHNGWKNIPKEERYCRIPEEARRRGVKIATEKRKQHIESLTFDEASRYEKKRRILKEQNGKCLFCKLNEWLGKPLVLEMDHKDGNKKNETRENLRILCPNCHSQTPTYRRNRKTK